MSTLPNARTEADYKLLDAATMTEALAIALHTLTNEQKNCVISDGKGGRVTVAEFIEYAIENAKI